MRRVLEGGDPDVPGPDDGLVRRLWIWSGSLAAYRLVQAVVLLTAFVAVWLTFKQAEAVRCSTEYNQASARYDASRSAANAADREALRKLVEAVIAPDATVEKTRAAGEEYLRTLERSDAARKATPVVPPPADFCR